MLLFFRISSTSNISILLIIFLLSPVFPVFSQHSLRCSVRVKKRETVCPYEKPLYDKKRSDAYQITNAIQHPYAVMVYCKTGKGKYGVCSGTLLTPSWVLTATHCFDDNCQGFSVYAGGNSLDEVKRGIYAKGSQHRKVSQICKHGQFDVTLVKVQNSFNLTKYVNTIPLPSGPLPKEVATCTFTAFGKIFSSEKNEIDYKRKMQTVKVICPCNCFYQHLNRKRIKVGDGDNFVCSVPREDYGVCAGDSGSGLVCKGILHGVTKSIISNEDINECIFNDPITLKSTCGTRDTTSIFMSVFPLMNWIDRNINKGNHSLDYENNMSPVVSSVPLVLVLFFASMICTLDYYL